jgi:hypothetical protein
MSAQKHGISYRKAFLIVYSKIKLRVKVEKELKELVICVQKVQVFVKTID